jgi:hypothetical protein
VTIYVSRLTDGVLILTRAESDDRIVGILTDVLRPGGTVLPRA